MATKFLRKIIMEELQKVLEEQTSNTDDWFRKNVADDSDVPPVGMTKRSSLPGEKEFMGPTQTASTRKPISLTPQQKYSRAIKNLKKQLIRLKLQTDLATKGMDEDTQSSLKLMFPAADIEKAFNTAEKIERAAKFLANKTLKDVDIAIDVESGAMERRANEKQKSISASPEKPDENSDDAALRAAANIGGSLEQKKKEEEAAKKAREVTPAVIKAVEKGLSTNESITREIRKLLRNI